MTPLEIEAKLLEIQEETDKALHGNAHELRDQLYEAVLKSIASGTPNAQELAQLALKSQAINFKEWYG